VRAVPLTSEGLRVTIKNMSLSTASSSQSIPSRWWALAATAATVLVVGLDTTILNVALPDIAVALNASSGQLQWFADSYLLVLGALLLPAGLLGDRYGRRRFTLGGLAVFGVGSLWCAFASSTGSLIAARTLLGVGAAVLIPLAMSAVVVLFEPEARPKAIVILGAATMLGLPLGPIVAGVLLQHFWWGSVFLVNLPVVVLAFAAVAVFLPESRACGRQQRLDAPGILLSSAGLVAGTYGVIEGPERGWLDPLVLAALCAGLLLLAAFIAWERRDHGLEPVVDRSIWRIPAFRWGSVTAATASLAFFGVMFVLPQYLRGVQGNDALGTGLRSVPMIFGLLVGLRLSMALLPRLGARTVGVAGFCLGGLGFVLGARSQPDSPYTLTAAWTAIVGAGVGGALFCGQNAALGSLPRERAAAGSALIQTLRQVGSVAGIALLGALLNGVYRSALSTDGLPRDVEAAVRQNVASGVAVAERLGSPSLLQAVQAGFLTGLVATVWVSTGVCVLGAVLVWLRLPDDRSVADHTAVAAPPTPDAPESAYAADVPSPNRIAGRGDG
jgi:MFS transporter, DHA2 family, multidrug resistance protein